MVWLVAMSIAVSSSEPTSLKERGLEVIEQIRKEYYLPKSKLYAEEIKDGKKSGQCFNWGTGVMLSALNSAAKADAKYKPWLREYADASRSYWNSKGPVPGYDVLPGPKDVDRYYDDNAWMVLSLVETYEVLGDAKYLDWAEESLKYVLSGWDDKLGGGIYWREKPKESKNTCSNTPSAAACLAVAKYRKTKTYADHASKIMKWTQQHLQDPADGIFWDNIHLNGKVDKMKYTYNTGLALRSWAGLAKYETIDQANLSRVEKSSLNHWIDPKTGGAKDGGKFVHLWFEGLAAVNATDGEAKAKVEKTLEFLYNSVRNPQGRYGDSWNKPYNVKSTKFALIDQASAARAYLFAAEWLKK